MKASVAADIMNYFIFHGEECVKPEALTAAPDYAVGDWEENTIAMMWEGGYIRLAYTAEPLEKDAVLDVFCAESEVYDGQLKERPHGPFFPVITIIVNGSQVPWDGTEMKDLYGDPDFFAFPEEAREDLLEVLPNESINVLDLCTLSEKDIGLFQSEFKEAALSCRAGNPVGEALQKLFEA